ncbi:diguanylate cyclase [Pelosinus sp. sgz500959]|uniref:sensor domain-containing diguanylate cyclase n=1 Tax=Pelosinus sp. sgz500959 TaxID=3242472 RepID=UPI00366FFA0A
MVRKIIIRGLFLCVLLLALTVLKMDGVSAREGMELSSYSISDLEISEDSMGTYRFDEISRMDYSNQYIPYSEKTLSLGITRSVYWVRFKLLVPNTGEIVSGQLLQLNNPNIDKIDIYIPITHQGEHSYIVNKVGVSRPSASRSVIDNTWVFQLTNEFDQQKFIYLRLESTSALRLPVRVWNSEDFIGEMFFKNLGFGAFYGILGVMLIFNLFIYSVLRDKAYLFYVLYIGFMFLYQFQVHGHLKILIDIPYRLYNAVFWLWLAAAFVCSVYFTRQFLQVEAELPRLNKVLTGIVMMSILQGILGILGYNVFANQIAHGLGILGPVFIMIVATIRFNQGFRPARYYILAWGVLSTGIVMWSLSAYLPGAFAAVNYLLLATASESVLLSLALADRVKTLRKEGEELGKSVKRYRDLSFTDGMTGLYNKRFFDMKIKEEMNSALQWAKPMSLLVIDIDKFKSYNDHYGHWEGDQVIIRLSSIFSQLLEEGQMAFRYGGEEFVILLPTMRCNDAKCIAEKIRQTVMNEEFFPAMKSMVTVTVSIGLTEMRTDDNQESFFQRADEALYCAKGNGRNQTIIL